MISDIQNATRNPYKMSPDREKIDCSQVVLLETDSAGEIRYLGGIRKDYIDDLPYNPSARILEIGCATGNTGHLSLKQGRCGYYCGVEICKTAAGLVNQKISDVVVGDIEEIEDNLEDFLHPLGEVNCAGFGQSQEKQV